MTNTNRGSAGRGRKRARKRKTNRQLLIDRLYSAFVDRTRPLEAKARKTSLLQSQAAHFAHELYALARGEGECPKHPDLVKGACSRCSGHWPNDPGDDVEDDG